MEIDSLKIRMYRHGFGDCFLLRYFTEEICNFSMLIDCGLKHNDSVEGVTIADVAKDIEKILLEGQQDKTVPVLDVLVVTHEHWDHVSGFHPDKKLFDHFKIEKIWMAWTENPADKEAEFIRKHIAKNITALSLATEKLKGSESSSAASYVGMYNSKKIITARKNFNAAIEEIASFFGPLEISKTPGGIELKDKYKVSVNSQKAMNHVKGFAEKETGIEYFYPGDLIENIKLPGIRIYVLGPPKSALLNKDSPSSGSKKEVYMGLQNRTMSGFVNSILQMNESQDEYQDSSPFLESDTLIAEEAQKHPFLKEYFNPDQTYRNIDDEWLNITGALALQLDNDTNNTSLAIAIEFISSGKVMLFPADAQVGSWLSWHDLKWEIPNEGNPKIVDMPSLLNRTVFYKAGHHASHNATLKELGLELMKSRDLVVFIPEKEEQYNGIPHHTLVDRLKEKSKGRTFFSADANEPAEKVLQQKPLSLSQQEWNDFKDKCNLEKLFIEYTIES